MNHTHLFSPNIYIPELLQNIAQHLPWSTLAHFADLPDPAPGVIPRELRRRVSQHLVRFIQYDQHRAFFHALEGSGAVITGSFVRRLLSEGDDRNKASVGDVSNLNIIVERYRHEPIASALIDCGYSRVEARVAPHFKEVSHSFTRFLKDVNHHDQHPSVTLTVAEEGTLSVILSSPTTADMTFLTANELVSLFPRLLRANECMVVERRQDSSSCVTRLEAQGLRVVTSNVHWSRPCDAWCPMRLRKTFGDKGIRRLTWHNYRRMRPRPAYWNQSSEDDASEGEAEQARSAVPVVRNDAFMYRDNIQWRVWNQCDNPHCPNSILASQRDLVLEN